MPGPAPFRKRPPMGHLRAMPGPYRSAGGYSTAPPLYTTVTSVSQSPVTAYLPLPAGIK